MTAPCIRESNPPSPGDCCYNDAMALAAICASLNDTDTIAFTCIPGSLSAVVIDESITYAKIQNVSATDRLLGRSTAGAGVIEEIVCTGAGRDLMDDVSAAAQRTTLGLGSAALNNTSDFDAAGAAAAALVTAEAYTDTVAATKQPLDATLTAFAALTIAANSLTIGTGTDAFSQTTFAANTFPARSSSGNLVAKTITDFGLSLVDDADAATARTTLGVGSGSSPTFTSVKLQDSAADNTIELKTASDEAADRTLTIPALGGNKTLAMSDLAQTFSGTQTFSSTIVGSVNGNAGTATALQNARTINGTSFDGTANITVTAAAGTLTGATLNSTVTASSLTSLGTQAQALNMGSHLINNVTDPVSAQDAATMQWVQNQFNDFDIKLAVRAATQANINFTRSGNNYTAGVLGVLLKATIDSGWSTGAALATGDRILLTNQTSNVDNGIVTITSLGTIGTNATLARSSDMDVDAEVTSEMRVPVSEGTDANIDYKLSAPGPFTLNTTALPFSRAGGPPTGAAGGSLGGTYPNPTVVTNANLTGPITSVGNATSIASQTGTGTKFVVDTSPTLVTPTLGVAQVTSINRTSGNLDITTTTSGDINVTADDDLNLTATHIIIDATILIELDALGISLIAPTSVTGSFGVTGNSILGNSTLASTTVTLANSGVDVVLTSTSALLTVTGAIQATAPISVGAASPASTTVFYGYVTGGAVSCQVKNDQTSDASFRATTASGDWLFGTGIGAAVNAFIVYDVGTGEHLRVTPTGVSVTGTLGTSNTVTITTDNAAIRMVSANPLIDWIDTSGANTGFRTIVNSSTWYLQAINDDGSGSVDLITVARSGGSISLISNTSVTGTFSATGDSTFSSGYVKLAGAIPELHLKDTSGADTGFAVYADGSVFYVASAADTGAASVNLLTIARATGNTTIAGTLTSSGTFTVTNGNTIIGSTGTSGPILELTRSAGTTADWQVYIPSGSTDLRWFAGGIDALTLTTAGALTSPARVTAKLLAIGPAPTDTYAASMTIAVTSSLHVVAGVSTTSATVTYTPSAAGTAGDRLTIITSASASGTVTATFASTFHSSGTQVTTASHWSTIEFVSDGTRWLEMSRTTNVA